MKMTTRIALCALVLSVAVVLVSAPCFAGKQFFAIATGGTGGTYYPLGGVLAQALSNKLPDVIVTAQSGNASVANCNLIREHEIESAFVQNNTAFAAYNGKEQFEGKPVKNIRGIASLYPEAIQIVARADAGIHSVRDLKGKHVVPGDKGSGTAADAANILKAYGMTFQDFGGLDWLSFSGISQRLQDKQADAGFITAGLPTAAVLELASSAPITIVNIEDDMATKIAKEFPFYTKVTIPANMYKGVDKPVTTMAVMAQWVVDEKVDAELVYQLTKALWEKGKFVLAKNKGEAADAPSGAEIMATAHEKGKDVKIETALAGMAIPLHPGAERYYKEKGLIK
ncbi:TAXI family TRAP transporter solute-binding subunit [Desulfatirhabdium butyrativorans]|uniref:TAXI family TRAP transporter solute-binding subunit n=1 Tax=Desulfatirhabdium butyrativorans TaxID=340467 RepID=UPI0003FE2D4F|nr:TAXI family TRAP transporter solute-binding subunit [Desulfatirhabdium butyrativorans]